VTKLVALALQVLNCRCCLMQHIFLANSTAEPQEIDEHLELNNQSSRVSCA
jgi:hypothetical protein